MTATAIAAAIALVGVLATVSATLVGHWITRQQNLRERERLKLDAAMRAADLFVQSGSGSADAARSASSLLALTQLDRADLAVALLVDLWSPHIESRREINESSSGRPQTFPWRRTQERRHSTVSTETAIQVINAALQSTPNAQLIAAELLCRNARSLDICQSLHWPWVIDSRWIPTLPDAAKLLIMDALVQMACANKPTKNALRSLAVRLYGIWAGGDSDRVKGCIGTLMKAILPDIQRLNYKEFMQGPGCVTLEQMEFAAGSASPNPDGYLEMVLEDRSRRLGEWSRRCRSTSLEPGALAVGVI